MDNNLFSIADEKKAVVVNVIKTGVQRYLIFFVLLFNVALEVVSKLYTFGVHNPFSAEFILNVSVTMVTTIVCYLCFIPFGRHDETKRNIDFKDINQTWKELSNKIRMGYLHLFDGFCKDQVCVEREDIKKHILENNTVIPYSVYKDKYEGLKKKDVKKFYERGEISKKDYKAILRANGYGWFNPTKIKPINPVIILAGTQKASLNDAGRSNSSTIPRRLGIKLALVLVVSVVLNSIKTQFIGGGEGVILDMIFSVFQIIIAAVGGYSVGVDDFKFTVDKINSRIIFISLFCEKNNISQKETPSI